MELAPHSPGAGILESRILESGILESGILESGILESGILESRATIWDPRISGHRFWSSGCTHPPGAGILESRILESGILESGILESGILESGILESGILESGILESPTTRFGPADALTWSWDPGI